MATFVVLQVNDEILLPFVANFAGMLAPGARELCRSESLDGLAAAVDLEAAKRALKLEWMVGLQPAHIVDAAGDDDADLPDTVLADVEPFVPPG